MPEDQTPRPIADVSRPGATAAAPNANPVITGNQTVVTDPMMAPAVKVEPATPYPAPVSPEEFAEQAYTPPAAPVPNPALQAALVEAANEPLDSAAAGTGHKLAHDTAFFGHVRKGGKGKLGLALLLLVLIGLAAIGVVLMQRGQL